MTTTKGNQKQTQKTQKRTTRNTRKKPVQKVVVVKSEETKLSKVEEEAQLRAEIAKSINEAQGKLSQLIELQRDLGTSDRTRFCKLERALRRNMDYTNLKTLVNV